MEKYDDIINLPHHVSDYHKPMPMENRAAQFAPFAALSGHNEAIAETARLTDMHRELSEDEQNRLAKKLNYVLENCSRVIITYFIPDRTKAGGTYKRVSGHVKKYEEIDRTLILKDGKTIPLDFISEIEIKDNNIEI